MVCIQQPYVLKIIIPAGICEMYEYLESTIAICETIKK